MARRLWKRIDGELWHVNPPHPNPKCYRCGKRIGYTGKWYCKTCEAKIKKERGSNPVGEVLTIVGGLNPPYTRRRSTMARRRRSHRRRSNPHGRRRHYARRHRRNPVASGRISVFRPMSYLPQLGTAAVGGMAAAAAPSLIFGPTVSTTVAYATQVGVAFVGAGVVSWLRILGPKHALPWLLGSLIGIVQEPVRRAISAASPLSAPTVARYPGMARYPALGALYYQQGAGSRYYTPRPVFAAPAFGRGMRTVASAHRAAYGGR